MGAIETSTALLYIRCISTRSLCTCNWEICFCCCCCFLCSFFHKSHVEEKKKLNLRSHLPSLQLYRHWCIFYSWYITLEGWEKRTLYFFSFIEYCSFRCHWISIETKQKISLPLCLNFFHSLSLFVSLSLSLAFCNDHINRDDDVEYFSSYNVLRVWRHFTASEFTMTRILSVSCSLSLSAKNRGKRMRRKKCSLFNGCIQCSRELRDTRENKKKRRIHYYWEWKSQSVSRVHQIHEMCVWKIETRYASNWTTLPLFLLLVYAFAETRKNTTYVMSLCIHLDLALSPYFTVDYFLLSPLCDRLVSLYFSEDSPPPSSLSVSHELLVPPHKSTLEGLSHSCVSPISVTQFHHFISCMW